jgi:hypothetical protein
MRFEEIVRASIAKGKSSPPNTDDVEGWSPNASDGTEITVPKRATWSSAMAAGCRSPSYTRSGGIVGVCSDITERAARERQAMERGNPSVGGVGNGSRSFQTHPHGL